MAFPSVSGFGGVIVETDPQARACISLSRPKPAVRVSDRSVLLEDAKQSADIDEE